jgi:molecular chaperone GrpE (heat shock protein)
MKDLQTSDPKEHSQNIRSEMEKLVNHLRKDINKIDDPHAKALFETSVEVINGLATAFKHYEEKSEEAWK